MTFNNTRCASFPISALLLRFRCSLTRTSTALRFSSRLDLGKLSHRVNNMIHKLFLLTCILNVGSDAFAIDFKVQNKLEKQTVGPYDNYQGVLSSVGSLFYTRSINLVTNVFKQNAAGDATLMLDTSANAKDPEPSPDGKKLAITYYKFDSKGDICIVDLEKTEEQLKCLTTREAKTISPFWFSSTEIGYLGRKLADKSWQLIKQDTATGTKSVLTEGEISSPTISPDGKLIAFNRYEASQNRWVVWFGEANNLNDLSSVTFELPGVTGLLRFSTDNRYLYFSHYLSDTNFDQSIDGNDHSVIFRTPLDKMQAKANVVFPEQITSVENNCNFPFPAKDALYLTCAFEGTLDVYKTALEGMIPQSWSLDDLWQAHAAARTYEERLLILNLLRFRFPGNRPTDEMVQRIAGNHLQIGESTAGIYYTDALGKSAKTKQEKDFYEVLHIFHEAQEAHRREPIGRVSLRFKAHIQSLMQKLNAISSPIPLKKLVNVFCLSIIEEGAKAKALLESLNHGESFHPLERHLSIVLTERLYPENEDKLGPLYTVLMQDPKLSPESRIFYTTGYLTFLDKKFDSKYEAKITRIKTLLGKWKQDAPESKTLLETELRLYALIEAKDGAPEKEAYKPLVEVMEKTKTQYFLRKAIYVRAIHNLSVAGKYTRMGNIASNWLRYTKVSEPEFAYAAAQYSYANMDKAYDYWAKQDFKSAADIFYLGVTQVDDLEAHYGITTMCNRFLGQRDRLEKDYKDLLDRKITDQNYKFVQALILFEDGMKRPGNETEFLDQAAALLESMEFSGFNPGMRFHLLGYVYHEKLLRTRKGYDYDDKLFQSAHRNYMIALDLGYDNFRSKAALLDNLANLHLGVGNYDIANGYFAQRSTMPFLSTDHELGYLWLHAKALFYTHQAEEATALMERALKLLPDKHPHRIPFAEHTAFYSVYAEKYERAESLYRELLKIPSFTASALNTAKSLLARGFALKNLAKQKGKEGIDWKPTLLEAIEAAQKLKPIPTDKERLVSFQPERIKIVAYGLLSQGEKDPAKAIEFKNKRIGLLEGIKDRLGDFASDQTAWKSQLGQDYFQLSLLHERSAQTEAQRKALEGAFALVQEGSAINPLSYRTYVNVLAAGVKNPSLCKSFPNGELQKRIEAAMKEFAEIKRIEASQVFLKLKLELLWTAYQQRVLDHDSSNLGYHLAQVLVRDEAKRVQEEEPEKYDLLDQFSRSLGAMK